MISVKAVEIFTQKFMSNHDEKLVHLESVSLLHLNFISFKTLFLKEVYYV